MPFTLGQIKFLIMISDRNKFLFGITEQDKIQFINLFEVFMSKDKSNSNPERIIRDLYIKGDVHWNEPRHQKVYQYLKTRIR